MARRGLGGEAARPARPFAVMAILFPDENAVVVGIMQKRAFSEASLACIAKCMMLI